VVLERILKKNQKNPQNVTNVTLGKMHFGKMRRPLHTNAVFGFQMSANKKNTAMITIPLNTNTGIRIPERTPPEKPECKQTKSIPQIGVSIPQAAKMLNIGKPLMSHLVKTGQIRAVKLGKRIVVSVQSLHDLVDGTRESHNYQENNDELQGKKEEKKEVE
jgi:excisionase family DNA binding protein